MADIIAYILEEQPDLTWEEVRAINQRKGWSYEYWYEGYSDPYPRRVESDRLRPMDLQKTWELARDMIADLPRQEYPQEHL